MKDIEEYARINKVPIMEKDSLDFMLDFIKNNNIKSILEIGTAIGYSTINMALIDNDINITTIERDNNVYVEALKNIKKFNLENRINVVFGDALNVDINDKYDLIFIDAAKGQYLNFFNKYCNNLNENGIIITDNIYFHGYVENTDKIESKDLRELVNKIIKYIEFLKDNKDFKTEFYKIGDGISISKRVNND